MGNEPNQVYFMLAILLVLSSGFLHSVWNLFTKRSVNKNVFLWLCQWIGVIVYLPGVISSLFHDVPIKEEGYYFLFTSMILHGIYVVLLAKTYSLGDLSQVYPIMRGMSPMLVPLLSVIFLNQHLSINGWIGVLTIVVGIVMISGFRSGQHSFLSNKVILLAAAVGISIASYIVVDAMSLRYWSPIVLNEATNLGNGLALSFAVLRSGAIRNEWRINWKTVILGGVLAPGGYLLFLYALSMAPVASLAPMREIGTVFGTLLGIFILHEKQGKNRIMASIVITTGVILLGISSH